MAQEKITRNVSCSLNLTLHKYLRSVGISSYCFSPSITFAFFFAKRHENCQDDNLKSSREDHEIWIFVGGWERKYFICSRETEFKCSTGANKKSNLKLCESSQKRIKWNARINCTASLVSRWPSLNINSTDLFQIIFVNILSEPFYADEGYEKLLKTSSSAKFRFQPNTGCRMPVIAMTMENKGLGSQI